MKKILSIALVAALVLTSAFAGFKKGEATIDFGYNLDTKDYGFKNGTSLKYNFGFVFGEEKASKSGEGDLRAEIEASFKLAVDMTDDDAFTKDKLEFDLDGLKATLKITKANILYKEILTFGILDAGKSADFAKSYYDDDDDDTADDNKIVALKGVPGFTVAYKDVINGGFGLTGNSETGKFGMLTYGTLKSFELAEGLKAQAGAAVKLDKANKDSDLAYDVQANGGIAYAKDLFSADFAADLKISSKFGAEISANAKYDFVTLNIYYFTLDSFENNNLNAKVAAEKTFDNVTVGGYFDARNVIEDARKLALGANVKAVIDAFTVSENVKYVISDDSIETTTKLIYTADMFTATAALKLNVSYADEFAATKINPELTVSTDKLIDGATVSLGWTGADFAEGADKAGVIKATAKIAL